VDRFGWSQPAPLSFSANSWDKILIHLRAPLLSETATEHNELLKNKKGIRKLYEQRQS